MSRPHPVVLATIAVNVGVFLLQNFGIGYFPGDGTRPEGPMGGLVWGDLLNGEVWRLASYAFVHVNFAHLAMNMIFLVYFCGGVVVERLGPVNFCLIYLLGAAVGGIANVYVDQSAYLVGASAAGFALLFAFATVDPDRSIFVFFVYRLRIVTLARALAIISVLFFILDQMRAPEAGGLRVAQLAHLGGALVGWAYVHALNRAAKPITAKGLDRERKRGEQKRVRVSASTTGEDGVIDVKTVEDETPTDVDAILDKINAQGVESLTEKEKHTLKKASEASTPGGT